MDEHLCKEKIEPQLIKTDILDTRSDEINPPRNTYFRYFENGAGPVESTLNTIKMNLKSSLFVTNLVSELKSIDD